MHSIGEGCKENSNASLSDNIMSQSAGPRSFTLYQAPPRTKGTGRSILAETSSFWQAVQICSWKMHSGPVQYSIASPRRLEKGAHRSSCLSTSPDLLGAQLANQCNPHGRLPHPCRRPLIFGCSQRTSTSHDSTPTRHCAAFAAALPFLFSVFQYFEGYYSFSSFSRAIGNRHPAFSPSRHCAPWPRARGATATAATCSSCSPDLPAPTAASSPARHEYYTRAG